MRLGFDHQAIFEWRVMLCPLVEFAWRNNTYVKTLRVFGLRFAVWSGSLKA